MLFISELEKDNISIENTSRETRFYHSIPVDYTLGIASNKRFIL
jgi:hypothetical protein